MRGASMPGNSASFPRVRTPAVISLAHDLKRLIVLLSRSCGAAEFPKFCERAFPVQEA